MGESEESSGSDFGGMDMDDLLDFDNLECEDSGPTKNSVPTRFIEFKNHADKTGSLSHEKTPITLSNYQTITNAQHPNGHWSDVTAFNAKFDIKDIIWKQFSDEKICGTVYALILLFSLFESQYNEWKLTAIKG